MSLSDKRTNVIHQRDDSFYYPEKDLKASIQRIKENIQKDVTRWVENCPTDDELRDWIFYYIDKEMGGDLK